jgi:hypothetical protein
MQASAEGEKCMEVRGCERKRKEEMRELGEKKIHAAGLECKIPKYGEKIESARTQGFISGDETDIREESRKWFDNHETLLERGWKAEKSQNDRDMDGGHEGDLNLY